MHLKSNHHLNIFLQALLCVYSGTAEDSMQGMIKNVNIKENLTADFLKGELERIAHEVHLHVTCYALFII